MKTYLAQLPHGSFILAAAIVMSVSVNPLYAEPIATTQSSKESDKKPIRTEEIRVNAQIEKDVGFAPTESQTVGKSTMRLLETPRSISIVTRELMESRQINTLQQALQTVAGVSPVTFGRRGFDDTNIRGFRSTESILIDGLAQSAGMWTRIQPFGYERFEVLKGASSILFGQVQPGGLINVVSKRPGREAFRELSLNAGSFGQQQVAFDINQPYSESGRGALRVNGLYSDTKDPTDNVYFRTKWLAPSVSFDLGRNTDLVIFATTNQAVWLRQQGVTPFGTLLPNMNGTIPTSRFTGEPGFGPYDIRRSTGGYTFEHRFSDAFILRQNVRSEREEGSGRFVTNGTLQANFRLQNRNASLQEMDYYSVATDTSVLSTFTTGNIKHQLVVGFDARRALSLLRSRACTIAPLDLFNPIYNQPVVCPATRSADAPSTLDVRALYLQDQIKFAQGWTLLLGARRDRSEVDTFNRITNRQTVQLSRATTFSGGLVYEFVKGWAAYASYAESFLPVAGLTFAGKPFDPETGEQVEAGIKFEGMGGRMTGSLAVFDLRRQNVTTADPININFSVQTGEQQAKGVELEAAIDLTSGWKANAAYTYTDTKVTKDNNGAILGKPINLTPKRTASVWATYRLAAMPQVTLGFGGRYTSDFVGTLPFIIPGYVVVDTSLMYLGQGYRINLSAKNIFDKKYYDGAINANVVSPALPRNFSASVTWFF